MGTWTHVVAQKRKGRKGELLHLSRNLVSLLVNRSRSWTWKTRVTSLWTLADLVDQVDSADLPNRTASRITLSPSPTSSYLQNNPSQTTKQHASKQQSTTTFSSFSPSFIHKHSLLHTPATLAVVTASSFSSSSYLLVTCDFCPPHPATMSRNDSVPNSPSALENQGEKVITSLHSNVSNEQDEDFGFTKAEQRRIIGKIDRRLVIMVGAMYCVSLMDRTNMSSANIAGMSKELVLTGFRYVSRHLSLSLHIIYQYNVHKIY